MLIMPQKAISKWKENSVANKILIWIQSQTQYVIAGNTTNRFLFSYKAWWLNIGKNVVKNTSAKKKSEKKRNGGNELNDSFR